MTKSKYLNATKVSTGFLLAYMAALTTATHWPNLSTGPAEYNDKVAHYLAYCILGLLVGCVWATRRRLTLGAVVAALAIVGLYGAMDELTQIPIPGRTGDPADWAADLLGGLTGILLCRLSLAIVKSRRRHPAASENRPEYSAR